MSTFVGLYFPETAFTLVGAAFVRLVDVLASYVSMLLYSRAFQEPVPPPRVRAPSSPRASIAPSPDFSMF
jgi:hypothetical protein